MLAPKFYSIHKKLLLPIILCFYSIGCNTIENIEQPLAYNHEIHVSEAGLDCTDCHAGVEDKMQASLPSIEQCESCHSEMQGESAAETLVVQAVQNQEEIPWQPIYLLDDFVFFSHRRHVKSGQISCATCHGEVEKLIVPPVRQLIPISMEGCMKCHDNKSISNDCLTCHV